MGKHSRNRSRTELKKEYFKSRKTVLQYWSLCQSQSMNNYSCKKVNCFFLCIIVSIITSIGIISAADVKADWNHFGVTFSNNSLKRSNSFGLIQMYDTVTFFCPENLRRSGKFIIYRLDNNRSSLVLNCSDYSKRQKFTVHYLPFNPLPNDIDYKYNHAYIYYAYIEDKLIFMTLKIAPRTVSIAPRTVTIAPTVTIHNSARKEAMTFLKLVLFSIVAYI